MFGLRPVAEIKSGLRPNFGFNFGVNLVLMVGLVTEFCVTPNFSSTSYLTLIMSQSRFLVLD